MKGHRYASASAFVWGLSNPHIGWQFEKTSQEVSQQVPWHLTSTIDKWLEGIPLRPLGSLALGAYRCIVTFALCRPIAKALNIKPPICHLHSSRGQLEQIQQSRSPLWRTGAIPLHKC